ncbi:MAG TPA: hypothetical protein VH599_09395 [Ktedonobacterales bacterium]|jgi:hypothetical protein
MIEQTPAVEDTPIACNLTGDEHVKRGEEVRALFHEVEQVRELDDGYAFRFPGGDTWASRLLEFTLTERRCCPFFTFELVFEPNEGPIWVHLRGSAAIKESLVGGFVAAATARA